MLLPTSLLLMQGAGGWDDSHRLSTHGYPGMTCTSCKVGNYRRLWKMTANSLVFEEDRQCKKGVNTSRKHCGPSHNSPPSRPSIHWRMIFEHKTILTCSTTSMQWYEGPSPASPLLPSPHPSPAM